MVAVGNDQLLIPHLVLNRGNHAGVRDLPDAVCDAIFIGHINGRSGVRIRGEQGIDLPGIFVQQKKLFVVNPRGSKQVKAVGLGLGQCLLVPIDDLGGIILHPAQRNESPALETFPEGEVNVCE